MYGSARRRQLKDVRAAAATPATCVKLTFRGPGARAQVPASGPRAEALPSTGQPGGWPAHCNVRRARWPHRSPVHAPGSQSIRAEHMSAQSVTQRLHVPPEPHPQPAQTLPAQTLPGGTGPPPARHTTEAPAAPRAPEQLRVAVGVVRARERLPRARGGPARAQLLARAALEAADVGADEADPRHAAQQDALPQRAPRPPREQRAPTGADLSTLLHERAGPAQPRPLTRAQRQAYCLCGECCALAAGAPRAGSRSTALKRASGRANGRACDSCAPPWTSRAAAGMLHRAACTHHA